MSDNFKILSPREHVRARTGMYLGSVSMDTVDRFVMGKWGSYKYVPAIFKMINEIIDNSVDESVRTSFKHANKIDVSVKEGYITVTDNGRGIPQNEVVDSSGEKLLQPVAAWTRVNAGTSFEDNRVTIGANGVGSSATNFLSSQFTGMTWRDGTAVVVKCANGAEEIKVSTKSMAGNGTKVSFTPDFSFFEATSLEDGNLIELVEDRLTALQLAFPEIHFSFNGTRIKTNDIKKYAELFTQTDASVVVEKSDNVGFFFAASEDGFRTNSYINGVNTYLGGSYVDYVVNGIVDELLDLIKKKHKVDITKSTIKNGLTFVLFARNFVNPKFDSQTKERLTSPMSTVREHYEQAGIRDFKSIAKKIFASADIIEPLIAAQIAKKDAEDRRNALVAQKKLKKVKVAKHIAANNDKATLALVEGDSAMGFLLKVRDPSKIGAFPLRGVILNTWDMKPAEVLKNKELSELVAVLGLNINDPDSVDDMTYQDIATLTDSDHDGSGHISPLIVAFLYKYWPRLLSEKRVKITRSPIMISSNGKDAKWFYTYEEANEFKQNSKGYAHRYIKGLGSLTEEEYSRILNEPVYDTVVVDNPDYFQMMFGNDSAPRKEFMTK